MTRLSARALNRTLLHRQHLLERVDAAPADLAGHLVGLQAQEPLPPYLSLLARAQAFDPRMVTRGLADRSLVRMITLRGTIHLHLAADALTLRPWTQPRLDAEERQAANLGQTRGLDRDTFAVALAAALADGPIAQPALGNALAERLPGHPPTELARLARVRAPLVQVPPRGAWARSGGVVYDAVDRWTGGRLVPPDEVDVEAIVRRYLGAFGPARAGDVTAWSGVTRLGSVVTSMLGRGELVGHEDTGGRRLVDLPDAELVDEDVPAPVRLLGTYDNVWLSHADRERVTGPAERLRWSGPNGASASTVFVDGRLQGLWRVAGDRVTEVETFRRLTRSERADLDEEVARVEAMLATPADDG